jgi:hypothetical protein
MKRIKRFWVSHLQQWNTVKPIDLIQMISVLFYVIALYISDSMKLYFPMEMFYWLLAPLVISGLRNAINQRKWIFPVPVYDDIALVLSLTSLTISIYSIIIMLTHAIFNS